VTAKTRAIPVLHPRLLRQPADSPGHGVIRQLAELKYQDSARLLRQVKLTKLYRRAITVNMGRIANDKIFLKSYQL
jgi:hypothetical protein